MQGYTFGMNLEILIEVWGKLLQPQVSEQKCTVTLKVGQGHWFLNSTKALLGYIFGMNLEILIEV